MRVCCGEPDGTTTSDAFKTLCDRSVDTTFETRHNIEFESADESGNIHVYSNGDGDGDGDGDG